MKRMLLVILIVAILLAGCSAADVASQNISTAADNFEVVRRIVFINGITNDYLFTITGKCSLGNYDQQGELSVTCKTDDGTFVKHFLGKGDNVIYIAEQLLPVEASQAHYRILFRPSVIVPNLEVSPGQ